MHLRDDGESLELLDLLQRPSLDFLDRRQPSRATREAHIEDVATAGNNRRRYIHRVGRGECRAGD